MKADSPRTPLIRTKLHRLATATVNVEERNAYMSTLEVANVDQDIRPFTDFLTQLLTAGLEGKPAPELPSSN